MRQMSASLALKNINARDLRYHTQNFKRFYHTLCFLYRPCAGGESAKYLANMPFYWIDPHLRGEDNSLFNSIIVY